MTAIRSLDFRDFTRQILAFYKPPLRAPKTGIAMRRVLELFGAIPDVRTTADLRPDLVALYVARRSTEVRTNTVIGELSYLKSACSYAVESGYLERTPFANRRLKLRKEPRLRRKFHPLADVARVLDHLKARSGDFDGGRLHALAATVAYTGLRAMEAQCLRVCDVDAEAGVLRVLAHSGRVLKTESSAQPVPMPPALAAVLSDWAPRAGSKYLFPCRNRKSPWTGGSPGEKPVDRLKLAALEVGVEGFTLLSLRHTWATHAESAWGLSEPQIQRVLRHTTPQTQAYYRHADLANLRAIAARVSYDPPTPPASAA